MSTSVYLKFCKHAKYVHHRRPMTISLLLNIKNLFIDNTSESEFDFIRISW